MRVDGATRGTPPPLDVFSLRGHYATGDWGGLRTELADHGFTVNAFFNHHYQRAVRGGSDVNSGKSSATMDLILDFDMDRLNVVKGGQLFIHARRQWGEGMNPLIGALQQVNDDADGFRDLHIDQLWWAQRLLDGKLTFRFGFLDYQTIVDRNAFANSEDIQFWNQSLDNNPIVPSIPLAGLGVAVFVRPVDWYTLILGIGDGDTVLFKPGFSTTFHDEARFFAYMEHGFHVSLPSERGPLDGNYRVGLAYDPRVKPVYDERFTDPRRRKTRGDDYAVYASFDQLLYRENRESRQGLGAFLRYGYRRGHINRVSTFWSTGFQYRGLIPTRDDDVVGFAAARQVESGRYRRHVNPLGGGAVVGADAETVYELYYAAAVTDWLVITPDIQYITHPGGDEGNADAVVIGVRTRVSF